MIVGSPQISSQEREKCPLNNISEKNKKCIFLNILNLANRRQDKLVTARDLGVLTSNQNIVTHYKCQSYQLNFVVSVNFIFTFEKVSCCVILTKR